MPFRTAHGHVQQPIGLSLRIPHAFQNIRDIRNHDRVELTSLRLVYCREHDFLVADKQIGLLQPPQPIPFSGKKLSQQLFPALADGIHISQKLFDSFPRMPFRLLKRLCIRIVAYATQLRPQFTQGVSSGLSKCHIGKQLEENAD